MRFGIPRMAEPAGDPPKDPGEPFLARCQRAGAAVAALGAASLIASDPATVRWLTGRTQEIEYGPPTPFSAGTLVVLDADGRGAIVCPAGEEGTGPALFGLEVRPYEAYSLGPLRPLEHAFPLVREMSSDGLVAIEAHALATTLAKDLSWVDATSELRSLRVVKDPAELVLLRRAADVVSVGQRAFRKLVRSGVREIDVFSSVHAALEASAGTRVPVFADVLSGERLMEVGRPPTTRTIDEGELVLCDLLIRVDGYWADSCLTICVGQPTRAMRRLHDACLSALDLGIAAVRPGTAAGDLDRLIRAHMADAGFVYPHHSGHGLGVEYHEEPRIVPGGEVLLEEGMVVALEPAAFDDGIGARVEHTIEVTASGCDILTDYDMRLDNA